MNNTPEPWWRACVPLRELCEQYNKREWLNTRNGRAAAESAVGRDRGFFRYQLSAAGGAGIGLGTQGFLLGKLGIPHTPVDAASALVFIYFRNLPGCLHREGVSAAVALKRLRISLINQRSAAGGAFIG